MEDDGAYIVNLGEYKSIGMDWIALHVTLEFCSIQ